MIATARMLPVVHIPTKSHPEMFARYPSTPLAIFPPPPEDAVSSSRTLRDRCGIKLAVKIESSAIGPKAGPWSPQRNVQPHRTNLPRLPPRKRNAKPRFAAFCALQAEEAAAARAEKAAATAPEPAPAPVPEPPAPSRAPAPAQECKNPELQPNPPKPEDAQLQHLMVALAVSFDAHPTAPHPYTHVVEIVHAHAHADVAGGIAGSHHHLRLVLPAAEAQARPGLGLADAQLRAARDFIADALPPAVCGDTEQTGVRVLVAAPPRRPTDAMAAAGCYLAAASGTALAEILRSFDEEEELLSVWKGEVSEDEIERVERVARA